MSSTIEQMHNAYQNKDTSWSKKPTIKITTDKAERMLKVKDILVQMRLQSDTSREQQDTKKPVHFQNHPSCTERSIHTTLRKQQYLNVEEVQR